VSVRLACLMHAASVNPEPGSNSPKICAACAATCHPRVRPLAHPSRIFLSLFSCQGAASGARQTAAQTHHDGASPPWCQTRRPSGPAVRTRRPAPSRGRQRGRILGSPRGGCQTPDGRAKVPRRGQIGLLSTSRMKAAPLSHDRSASSAVGAAPIGPIISPKTSVPTMNATPALASRRMTSKARWDTTVRPLAGPGAPGSASPRRRTRGRHRPAGRARSG
jgi:hypothetical protein